MFGFQTLTQRLGPCVIAAAALLAPLAAGAQELPSYARPSYVSADETIHGRIRSVDGAFNIWLEDDRGFVDNVELHPGTIINPTGLTLDAGMSVTILGVNDGSAFSANEIDTPYSYAGPLPAPVYYGPGYWCPGFAYGYGPAFSLAIVIGGGRPWYFEHHRFHGRPWNGHGDGHSYFRAAVVGAPYSRRRAEAGRMFEHRPPSAFTGRSFAGGSTFRGERFSTVSTRNAPLERRGGRGAAIGGFERGSAVAGGYRHINEFRGGGMSRASASPHGGRGR